MEFKKLIPAAALALVMTACSSDEPAITTTNPVNFEGTGYVAVSINLPTTTGSRGINDDFDNGESYEYSVGDALLVLFSGKDEANATFHGAYDIAVEENEVNPNPSNVTTHFTDVVKIDNINVNETTSLYALVLVNYKDIASIDGSRMAIEGKSFTGTFGDLNAMITDKDFYKVKEGKPTYFFMANTPQVNQKGGLVLNNATLAQDYELTTLVKMDSYIYDTEADAKKETAAKAEIFVERAMAKVTLKASDVTSSMEGTDLTLDAKSLVWKLDNMEPTSYIVRNMGNHADYMMLFTEDENKALQFRMVGDKPFKSNVLAYRPYWCIDPNYSNDERGYIANPAKYGEPGDLYCHENTFDVAHQVYNQTTRVLVQAKFELKDNEGNKNFYTVGDDKKTIYSGLDKAQTLAESFIMKDAALQAAVEAALEAESIIVTNENLSNYVTVVWNEKNAKTGGYTVKELTFKNGEAALAVDFVDETLVANANKLFTVYEYVDGISYYDIRIKHFGDELTPWTAVNGNSVDVVYGKDPEATTKYLGRYGMVRNNWYQLTIKSINNLGSPVEPDATVTTSDDNKEQEQWINFTINILSWAKRTQSVDF